MESAESPQVISISLSGQKDRYGGIGMIPQNKTTSLDEPVKDTIVTRGSFRKETC